MLDDRLSKYAVLKTKNTELNEINAILEAYISIEMRISKKADTMEIENQNALRYPVEMLSAFNNRSAVQDNILNLKIEFILMLLGNVDLKNDQCERNRTVCGKHDEQRSIPTNRQRNAQGSQNASTANELQSW